MATTRLAQIGIGCQPYAGFLAKTPSAAGGHPFSLGTRLSLSGVMARPYAGFSAKTPAATPDQIASWTYQVDACRQGSIVAEGCRQSLNLDVVFDPVKAEIS